MQSVYRLFLGPLVCNLAFSLSLPRLASPDPSFYYCLNSTGLSTPDDSTRTHIMQPQRLIALIASSLRWRCAQGHLWRHPIRTWRIWRISQHLNHLDPFDSRCCAQPKRVLLWETTTKRDRLILGRDVDVFLRCGRFDTGRKSGATYPFTYSNSLTMTRPGYGCLCISEKSRS